MAQVALDTPLYEVLGARSAFLRRLENLGIHTVRDLLFHFPARYEDFSKVYSVAELEPGQQATIQGVVEEVHLGRSFRRQMSIVEATIADDSGTIRAIWFNQPYVANILKVGRLANFSGKVSLSDESEMYLSHPAYEALRGTPEQFDETKHTARLVPIYPETRGLTSRGIRFIMQSVLKRVPTFKEWIPQETLAALGFPDANHALQAVHFPQTLEEASAATRRFSFEDLFLLQLVNLQQKLKLAQEKAPVVKTDIEHVKAILAELPFELTPSQKKSLWEIIKDIEKPSPMNRLLQGDVGSGKTVVAAIAAISAAANGVQTAFMAPTEILARQHFETMKGLLARMSRGAGAAGTGAQPAIGLLTGTSAVVFYENDMAADVSRAAMAKKVENGEVAIVFGTHALIEKAVSFKNLGLVIIDEQHRFGVRQRAALGSKKNGANGGTNHKSFVPHFLSMSATPIPRTLMLTVFGDLDLSLITELPGGRKPVNTKIVMPIERQLTYDFVKKEVRAGRQVFVICPRIEPSAEETAQKLELRSVKEEYEKLRTKIFPDLRLAMLHGQMKPKEKEDTMRRFKDREFDILVTTSVVEVGVDVPNATVMMIEGAERFGLAQLYQFRGRVGRGENQSYCFLMADSDAKAANARLKALMEATNGFELAEKDLALRGPGQFFGEVQTGLPDIAMSALQDPELVKASREAAVTVVKSDPSLKAYPALKVKMAEFRHAVHLE
ncbi:MAG TPA: ATP-dependent DNA helicase RecG [Candidatus Paceibacterota bacterium]|jgi:ATP-dependent DNA helicase RecG|nr:ATP-dependent DNA helicase RecG [Candidatus Paceibacterota bacterium]